MYAKEQNLLVDETANLGQEHGNPITKHPVFQYQSSRQTGCNRILVRFLLAKSPTTALNVLNIPFTAARLSKTQVIAALDRALL